MWWTIGETAGREGRAVGNLSLQETRPSWVVVTLGSLPSGPAPRSDVKTRGSEKPCRRGDFRQIFGRVPPILCLFLAKTAHSSLVGLFLPV